MLRLRCRLLAGPDASWAPDVTANRRLANLVLRILFTHAGPDTTSRMALLSRRALVLIQHLVYELANPFQLWTLPLRALSLRRYRAFKGLTHHPMMNPVLLRHSFDRSHSVLVLT